MLGRGPLTEKEREERRLRKELEKAEKLLSRHQAREDKENVKQAEKEERDKAREVTRRNASRMAMEDLQVKPPGHGSCMTLHARRTCSCQRAALTFGLRYSHNSDRRPGWRRPRMHMLSWVAGKHSRLCHCTEAHMCRLYTACMPVQRAATILRCTFLSTYSGADVTARMLQ